MKKMNRTAIDSANSVCVSMKPFHPPSKEPYTDEVGDIAAWAIRQFRDNTFRKSLDKIWQTMAKYGKIWHIYRFHQTLIRTCWAVLSSIQHTCRYIEILPRHLLESGIVMAPALLSPSASSTQLNYDFCGGLMTDDLYGVGFCLSRRLCWLPNHPII